MPRIWKAAVSCNSCGYPNDNDHHFCQRCGKKRESSPQLHKPVRVNIESNRVENRLISLKAKKAEKPYQRHKSSLQSQLESYLFSLPIPKSIATASPSDVTHFLAWRDKFGKTLVHKDNCRVTSSKQPRACECQKGLAAGTIDNNIAKLRSIFRENGRGSYWNDDLRVGNPASHLSVREYYLMVLEEQALYRTFPSQAVPIFLDKVNSLCRYLRSQLKEKQKNPTAVYILARDLAFFSIDFYSGDRGSDLGRVKSVDILSLPDNEGYIFNQRFGKTLRGNGSNVFAIKKVENSPSCPVSNLRCYLTLTKKMSINLESGYLFRATDHRGYISEAPFVGSTVANRLKKHLDDAGLSDGETMHSFRSGCSITLAALGSQYADIARHVGWKSMKTALYYTQFEKVCSQNDVSSLLSNSTAAAEQAGKEF